MSTFKKLYHELDQAEWNWSMGLPNLETASNHLGNSHLMMANIKDEGRNLPDDEVLAIKVRQETLANSITAMGKACEMVKAVITACARK